MPFRQAFLDEIKQGAIDGWRTSKILPSITAAQALHESDWGRSNLAKAPNYNLFGIKASADWTGATVWMNTNEHVNGTTITIQAEFRKYDSWSHSAGDHGEFFTSTEWRKNNYRLVVGETDYKKAAQALQSAGYATDPLYASKLINHINNYKLHEWDSVVSAPTNVGKVSVGGALTQAGRDYLKNVPVTVLGDSLGVGTQPKLKEIMNNMTFSVHGSRQITHPSQIVLDGTRALESMLSQPEKVRENFVVILGTNAGLTTSEVTNFIKLLGNRNVYWVNTASKGVINQSRRDNVTNEIRKAAENNSNVYLLDWDSYSKSNWNSYYGSDEVHMNDAGYKAHAEFIASGIYEVLNATGKEAPPIPVEQVEKDTVGYVKKDHIGIEDIEYDDGRFYSLKGESSIQDREANQRFSRYQSSTFGWVTRPFSFPTDNVNELFKESLEALKKWSTASVTYNVPLSELPNCEVGDWIDIADHDFNPALYLTAQVIELHESDTDEDLEYAVLSNFNEVGSGIPNELESIRLEINDIQNVLTTETSMTVNIKSTEGLIFDGKTNSTILKVSIIHNGLDVTEYADSFKWWRHSDALTAGDDEWTAANSSYITVSGDEFAANAVYHVMALKKGRVLGQTAIALMKVRTGIWATDDEPVLSEDGEIWVKSDGTQSVKVAGTWKPRVDEEKVSQIVHRDGFTTYFGMVEPGDGKTGDVWFKLRDNGTQSIMRFVDDDWFETVTNALDGTGILGGVIDFAKVGAIHIDAASISVGHADFISVALEAINSKLLLDGTALRILNDDGSFIEMNNVPEIRTTAPNGTSTILGNGRVHFYDSIGNSKGYVGTDMHGGTRDFGTFLSKGSGVYRFARMADVTAVDAKYYTVEHGDARVSIITKLVQRGLLPDGDGAAFIAKGNAIAKLNGWAIYPKEWPTLRTGQRIKYSEASVTGGSVGSSNRYYTVQAGQGWNAIAAAAGVPIQTILDLNNLTISDIVHPGDILLIEEGTGGGAGNEEAYEDIWKFGPSSQPDATWKIYFAKEAVFEGGYSEASDRRIKHDILPTEIEALPEIEFFNFKRYAMNSDDRMIELGLIAQDSGVLRVPGEVEGVDLRMATMLALKGIQELQAVVKEQAQEIERLKNEVSG